MRGHFTLYSNPLCGYYYALYSYKNRGKHIPWDHGWGCALGEKTKTRVFGGSKDPPFPEKKLPLVDIYIKKLFFEYRYIRINPEHDPAYHGCRSFSLEQVPATPFHGCLVIL